MISNAQLIFAIEKDYPGLVHGVDYWVGQPVDGDTYLEESKIYAWYPEDIEQPDHATLIARATALLPEYEESIKPPPKTRFPVREFRQRFTIDEQVAIRAASMTDMEVGLVYDDFQSAQYIDVTDPDVAAGIDLYVSKSLLQASRKAELLEPEPVEP